MQRSSFKIPCLFVLHDHMCEEDSPSKYCSEGMHKQGDGFYGLVDPFPTHSSDRYQPVKFVRIEGQYYFIPLAGDESEIPILFNSVLGPKILDDFFHS